MARPCIHPPRTTARQRELMVWFGWKFCRRVRGDFHHPTFIACDCLRTSLVPHEARPYSHGALRR